jgi:hypothetical protein
MTEPEVRGAYTLALRLSAGLKARWDERALPLNVANDRPRILVSAVPMGPDQDVLGLRDLQSGALTPPPEVLSKLRRGHLTAILHELHIWADGFVNQAEWQSGSQAAIRIHRDGSVGTMETIEAQLWIPQVLRALNCHLVYTGWVWQEHSLRAPFQLHVELDGLDQCTLVGTIGTTTQPTPVPAAGYPVSVVRIEREVIPWELARASVRHRVMSDFADRLSQAFGSPRYDTLFQRGWLYRFDGRSTTLILRGGRLVTMQVGAAAIDKAGAMRNPSTGEVCGYAHDGAVIDLNGDALAVTEFAIGAGCPDGFVAEPTDRIVDTTPIEPSDALGNNSPPTPTGKWSAKTLKEVVAPQ